MLSVGTTSRRRSRNNILEHVRASGKFDFALCTHVVEDLNNNPAILLNLLGRIANGGFLATPSKFVELSRFEIAPPGLAASYHATSWRGYYHHRWIFDLHMNGGAHGDEAQIVAFPKLPLLEMDHVLDTHLGLRSSCSLNAIRLMYDELRIVWAGSLPLKVAVVPNYVRAIEAFLDVRELLANQTFRRDWPMLLRARKRVAHCLVILRDRKAFFKPNCPFRSTKWILTKILRAFQGFGASFWMHGEDRV